VQLSTEVGFSQGHIVLGGNTAPPERGTAAPNFLAHVYCGQTAGWIKMPLGMEVGLGPGHIVLDGDSSPTEKGRVVPTIRTMSIGSFASVTWPALRYPCSLAGNYQEPRLLKHPDGTRVTLPPYQVAS